MWEASVSVSPMGRAPVPMLLLGEKCGSLAVAKCISLLVGVGDHESGRWHTDSVSVHFRCPLTEDEMARLPEGWLSCPAVDRGGNEDRMTEYPPFPLLADAPLR